MLLIASDGGLYSKYCKAHVHLHKPNSIVNCRNTVLLLSSDPLWFCLLQVVDFQISKGPRVIDKPANVFRIAFIERKHKRRIMNFQEVLEKCQAWQLPTGTKYKHVECWTINLDDSKEFPEQLSQLQSLDALVSVVQAVAYQGRPHDYDCHDWS